MCSGNEQLDREKIKRSLDRDIEIYLYSLIDSTNNEAKRLAEAGTSVRALILAEEQSGGRGRMGRSFYSPRGVGLYMTLLFPLPDEAEATLRITSIAAVALKRSIYRVYGIETKIKWVNDIYLDGSKAAGILAESFMGEKEGKPFKAVAVGIGVNISTEIFPAELERIAVSLGKHGGRDELAAEMTNEFFALLDKAVEGDFSYMNEYRESSLCLGRQICFTENGHTETGVVECIDDMGFLHVTLSDGKQKILSSGEITVRFENKGK